MGELAGVGPAVAVSGGGEFAKQIAAVEELGAVGKPVKTNPKLLDLLTANGFLPVVACVAGDSTSHTQSGGCVK